MAEAADETQRRWRHVQDTVFSTSITQDEQVAAWTRLSQQGLTYVERLLSVPSERLPAVLRYQARGEGGASHEWSLCISVCGLMVICGMEHCTAFQ